MELVRFVIPLALVALLTAAGCAAGRVIEPSNEGKFLRSVPRDGETTLTQVLAEYGEPHAVFEEGRIVAYRLTYTGPQEYVTLTSLAKVKGNRAMPLYAWRNSHFSLVLVFEGEVVRRHSLVEVR